MKNAIDVVNERLEFLEDKLRIAFLKFKECDRFGDLVELDYWQSEINAINYAIFEVRNIKCLLR